MSHCLHSTAATHAGTVRPRNEDAFVDRTDLGLWAVADGAGGHGAGDLASAIVVEALQGVPADLSATEMLGEVRTRIANAHAKLQQRAQEAGNARTIATTIVVLLARSGHYACLWAGDSRAYLLRAGQLARITRDHSLVQELMDQGAIAEADAEGHPKSNVITRAVGARGELDLEKVSAPIAAGDRFLLCSDGLFRTLGEPEIAACMARDAEAGELVQLAVERGARDNVTAVALRDSA